MSLLRVFRYLWEGEPAIDPDNECVVLGIVYPASSEWDRAMLEDIRSRIWLMYRNSFEGIVRHPEGPSPLQLSAVLRGSPIDSAAFGSDIGWGCMIRTGQCLLANALLNLELGRDWRMGDSRELEIVRMFADTPKAPLSIHKFVALGVPRGKLPGQWFGPSTVAQCIRELSSISVYVSEGMDIYVDELLALEWPVLVLCPVRLGIAEINRTYYAGIQQCLKSRFSVGIAGGRTSASHYFYGFQADRLLFHDPHFPKQALDFDAPDLDSVHSDTLRAMPLSEMDPSMLVGFVLNSRQDFDEWSAELEQLDPKSRIITLAARRPEEPQSEDDVDGYVFCDESDPPGSLRQNEQNEDEVLVAPPQVADEASVFI